MIRMTDMSISPRNSLVCGVATSTGCRLINPVNTIVIRNNGTAITTAKVMMSFVFRFNDPSSVFTLFKDYTTGRGRYL